MGGVNKLTGKPGRLPRPILTHKEKRLLLLVCQSKGRFVHVAFDGREYWCEGPNNEHLWVLCWRGELEGRLTDSGERML